jgi:hypothetical protein
VALFFARYRRATKFAAASKSGFKNVKVCRIAEGCCSAPDLERYFLIHVMCGGLTAWGYLKRMMARGGARVLMRGAPCATHYQSGHVDPMMRVPSEIPSADSEALIFC